MQPTTPIDYMLQTALMPAIIAIIALAILRKVWKPREDDFGRWAIPIALGAVTLTGYLLLDVLSWGLDNWDLQRMMPAANGANAAFWIGIVAFIIGIFQAIKKEWSAYVLWPIRILFSSALAYASLQSLFSAKEWSLITWVLVSAPPALLITISWAALDDLIKKAPALMVNILITGALITASGLLLLNGSLEDGLRLRAPVIFFMLLTLLSIRDRSLPLAGVSPIVMLISGSLILWRYYSSLPADPAQDLETHWAPMLILGLIFPTAWLAMKLINQPSEASRPALLSTIRIAPAVIIAVIAMTLSPILGVNPLDDSAGFDYVLEENTENEYGYGYGYGNDTDTTDFYTDSGDDEWADFYGAVEEEPEASNTEPADSHSEPQADSYSPDITSDEKTNTSMVSP